MFGLTTRARLRAEVDAHLTTIRRMIATETERDEARQALSAEIDAHINTIRARNDAEDALAAERRTSHLLAEQLLTKATPHPVVHPDALWSLIDWSLWGSGMGDTFRERLTDTFLQAITPEDHEQALEQIRWWTEDRGREPLGRRRYEHLNRRLDRALANVVRWRKAAHQLGFSIPEPALVTEIAEEILSTSVRATDDSR